MCSNQLSYGGTNNPSIYYHKPRAKARQFLEIVNYWELSEITGKAKNCLLGKIDTKSLL
jgi:hypothetical protein